MGATGLEPATSGVTERRILQAFTCKSVFRVGTGHRNVTVLCEKVELVIERPRLLVALIESSRLARTSRRCTLIEGAARLADKCVKLRKRS